MASKTYALTLLARSGYAARGVVYLIVGFFALLAAFGQGDSENSRGALQTLLEQPFGNILVWAMVVGLCGYALWRAFQSLSDPDGLGHDLTGLTVRLSLLISGLTYLGLALYALALLGIFSSGSAGGNGGGSIAQTMAGFVGSRVVSLGLCAIFAGIAIAHWFKAAKRRYQRYIEAPARHQAVVDAVSMAGLTARGFVFAVLAVLLFYRGIGSSEGEGTPGLEAALEFVQGLPLGTWLLALMGLGLIAFAFYSFIESRWRRILLSAPRQG